MQMIHSQFKSWVTPKVERRESGRNGKGVYTVRPIAKDERIWSFLANRLAPQNSSARWQHYQADLAQIANPLGYAYLSLAELGGESFTHSCAPNAGFGGTLELVAMQQISPAEPITFDYAMCFPFPFGLMTCHCGALTCRKVVTGNDWELPELQQRYQGYFQPFIAEKIAQAKKRRESLALSW